MSVLCIEALRRIRSGGMAIGLGVHHLRGAAVPMLAKAAGYDWLFIDSEHGTISIPTSPCSRAPRGRPDHRNSFVSRTRTC